MLIYAPLVVFAGSVVWALGAPPASGATRRATRRPVAAVWVGLVALIASGGRLLDLHQKGLADTWVHTVVVMLAYVLGFLVLATRAPSR